MYDIKHFSSNPIIYFECVHPNNVTGNLFLESNLFKDEWKKEQVIGSMVDQMLFGYL